MVLNEHLTLYPCVKLTFISCFKFKLLTVATVSCGSPHSNMKYVLGGWLETCDDDTGGLGPCGGIGELLMLLGTEKKKMQMKQLFYFFPETNKVNLRNMPRIAKVLIKKRLIMVFHNLVFSYLS